MPRSKQPDRERGVDHVGGQERESLRTSGREEGPGRVPGQGRDVSEGERGTQSDESFIGRETERVGGASRQEPRRQGNLDRGRTASPRRTERDRSGEQGVSQRISRGEHQQEDSGLEEETSL
jgi:hypothetical protein